MNERVRMNKDEFVTEEETYWSGLKVGTTEGKHGTGIRGKKDILTKCYKG